MRERKVSIASILISKIEIVKVPYDSWAVEVHTFNPGIRECHRMAVSEFESRFPGSKGQEALSLTTVGHLGQSASASAN